jgi:hypothetical protein
MNKKMLPWLLALIAFAIMVVPVMAADPIASTCTASTKAVCAPNGDCYIDCAYSSSTTSINALSLTSDKSIKITSAELWQNVSHPAYVQDTKPITTTEYISIPKNGTTCEKLGLKSVNTTDCSKDIISYGSIYVPNYYYDWTIMPLLLDKVSTNIQTAKMVRLNFKVSPKSSGKFSINMETPYSSEMVDPWWNTTYQYYRNTTVTENSGLGQYNAMKDTWINHGGHVKDTTNCLDTVVITPNGSVDTYWLTGCNATHVHVFYRYNVTGGANNNYTVYYGASNVGQGFNVSSWQAVRNGGDSDPSREENGNVNAWLQRCLPSGNKVLNTTWVADGSYSMQINSGIGGTGCGWDDMNNGPAYDTNTTSTLSSAEQPTYISFNFKRSDGGDVIKIINNTNEDQWSNPIFFYNGEMCNVQNSYWTGGSCINSGMTTNTAYFIELKNIDWAAGTLNYYVNGTEKTSGGTTNNFANSSNVLHAMYGIRVSGWKGSESQHYYDNFTILYNITSAVGAEQIYVPPSAPAWSGNTTSYPINYSGISSQFNVSWTDDSDTNGYNFTWFESNFSGTPTNYTTTRYGNVSSYSAILPAGTFYWKMYANDSANAWWNYTDTWVFVIGKSVNPISLVISPSTTIINPTPNTADCGTTVGVPTLYRNGSTTSNQTFDSATLTAGAYNYTCFINTVQNYTGNTTVQYLTVLPQTVNITLPTIGHLYWQSAIPIQFSCNGSTDLNYIVYSNNTNIATGTMSSGSTVTAIDNITDLGGHNITVNCTNNNGASVVNTTNYTANISITPNSAYLQTIKLHYYNETDNATIVASYSGTFYVSSGSLHNSNSISTSSASTSHTLYIVPNDAILPGNASISYSSSDGVTYPVRHKVISLIYSNTSQDIELWLLPLGSGQYINFYVLKSGIEAPISGATVSISKYIFGKWIPITSDITDDVGSAMFYLNQSNYIVNVSAPGCGASSTMISLSTTTYKLYMTCGINPSNYTPQIFDNMTMYRQPEGAAVYWNKTTFNYSITANNSDLTYYAMRLIYCPSTGCNQVYSSNQSDAGGGLITKTYDLTGSNGTIIMDTQFKRIGYSLWDDNMTYYIWPTQDTMANASNTSISALIYQMKMDYAKDDGSGLDPFAFSIIMIIMTIISMAGSIAYMGNGGSLIGLGVLGIFIYIGNYIYPNFWFNWIIFTILFIGTVGFIFLRGRE